MSWRERAAEILGKALGAEPTKLPEVATLTEKAPAVEPTKPTEPLLSVLSVPTLVLSDDEVESSDTLVSPRRKRVLDMLAKSPCARYAVAIDTDSDPDFVIATVAIQDAASCELQIPRENFDPFLLLDLIAQHGSVTH
jgi:hypothetical protein